MCATICTERDFEVEKAMERFSNFDVLLEKSAC